MATYTKKLKAIQINFMNGGDAIQLADTATDDIATRALNQFKAYDDIYIAQEGDEQTVYYSIPYHTIMSIEVTEADESVSKVDPYGCDDTVTVTYYKSDRETVYKTEVYSKGDTVTVLDPDLNACSSGALGMSWSDGQGGPGDQFIAETDVSLYADCFN